MDRQALHRVALALLTAALLLLVGSNEASADSKKAKGNGAAKAANARAAAPVTSLSGPASVPTPVATTRPTTTASANPTAAADAPSTAEAGTITTEEARQLAASDAASATSASSVAFAPPVPTVDPLSLITPVRRTTLAVERQPNPAATEPSAQHVSFFPVPSPLLTLLLVLSQAALLFGIRRLRRLAFKPTGAVRPAM